MKNIGSLRDLSQVNLEYKRAVEKFPKFNSLHEGYAVLKEEVDELWDEIKRKHCSKDRVRKEAIQVAAMAIRIIRDCCLGHEQEARG